MAKLKNPLISFDARGTLAKALSFVKRRGQNIVEKKPEPFDAKTGMQLSWRHMYLKAVALWNALSPAEKQDWKSLARPRHMTGFAWFISQALKPNPGLYLPLQGGTMAGDIDMSKHRVLKLPAPADAQEADTLTARNQAIAAHAALPYVHHALPDIGEGNINLSPLAIDSVGAGVWAVTYAGQSMINTLVENTSHNDGDNFTYKVALQAGTYTMNILSMTWNNKGILDIYIGGVEVASHDMYSAGQVWNVQFKTAGIVIPTSGLKDLVGMIDGKNPASSDHYCNHTAIFLWRTV